MKKFDVHVCLVSGQPLPNFIPVLAEEFRPQEVILLATEAMAEKAVTLAEVIWRRCRIKAQIMSLRDEYDMQSVGDKVWDLLVNIDKDKVALNVTGGTKLMAIAAYGMFRDAQYPVFYFTAKDNQVLLLDSEEHFVLQPPKIKIEDYLQLHGYPVREGYPIHRQHQRYMPNLWRELANGIDNFAESISALNYVIAKANGLVAEIPAWSNKHLNQLLNLFEENGLLTLEKGKIHFIDKEAKNYVGGGWFEDYVFDIVKRIPGIQDVALNVQIENASDKTKQYNELDVVVLANNVLHVLEVKTIKFTGNKKAADDILYKLETLKKLGGLRTQTALISYRETSDPGQINSIRDRAEGAGINLIERKDLKGLKTLLSKWMGLNR